MVVIWRYLFGFYIVLVSIYRLCCFSFASCCVLTWLVPCGHFCLVCVWKIEIIVFYNYHRIITNVTKVDFVLYFLYKIVGDKPQIYLHIDNNWFHIHSYFRVIGKHLFIQVKGVSTTLKRIHDPSFCIWSAWGTLIFVLLSIHQQLDNKNVPAHYQLRIFLLAFSVSIKEMVAK